MSDRFLGVEFHKKIGIGKNIYPYVLIADAAGCNLRCWFCYAHKLLENRDYEKQNPTYLSPEELASCYLCKMQFAVNYISDRREPLLSRIRITGGEPLAHVHGTFRGAESTSASTIDYYLEFFRYLNDGLNRLIDSNLIKIIYAEDLKNFRRQKGKIDRPTWIAIKPGRITIRFDTNGLIFGNRENARRFIEGLFKLNHDYGKLNRIYVEIDYSIKGSTITEYFWSQSRKIGEKNEPDFDLLRHPQIRGIKNISEIRKQLIEKDPSFGDSLYLTVEKGIDHHLGKCYLYDKKALDWTSLERQIKEDIDRDFRFSDVPNPIQSAKQWGLRPYLQRYLKKGMDVALMDGDQEIFVASNNGELEKLLTKKREIESVGNLCHIVLTLRKEVQRSLGEF